MRAIAAAGHEVASHGYGHEHVYTLGSREFRSDVLRSKQYLEDLTGKAACTREPKGYIYGTPAQLWMVVHNEGQASLSLTFWRPASGAPDMFNLGASLGAKSHVVTTTKGPAGGRVQGSGQVKLVVGGKGGTFTIDATTATGSRITGTVKCDAFPARTEVGGN